MYDLYNNGVDDNTWTLINNLNSNLKARIKTKHGLTREIKSNSIKQGSVLAGKKYALSMDNINKETEENQMGINLDEEISLPSLEWIDDVIFLTTDPLELQKMLNIAYDYAGKYLIEYGEEKTKHMIVNEQNPENRVFHLGKMRVKRIKKYKYLGLTINDSNNLNDHIKDLKRKIEAAFQTILSLCQNQDFKGLELEIIWKLVESCIQPIILSGLEAWQIKAKEMKELNRLQEKIIKRFVMIPTSTPTESLYIETGLTRIEELINKNRILMEKRLSLNKIKIVEAAINLNGKTSWLSQNEKIKNKYQINTEEKLSILKHKAKSKIRNKFKEEMTLASAEKSKMKYLRNGQPNLTYKRKIYLEQLSRSKASIIMKTRTRMLEVKNNFKKKYGNNILCRKCNNKDETQEHILNECKSLHKDENLKVTKTEIFENNIENLKKVAAKIEKIMEILKKPVDK